MRGLSLRKATIRLLLGGMNDVWKFDRVLDEEHRDVVADEVPIPFLSVQLDGKSAHVARKIRRPFAAGNRREAHEYRRLFAEPLKQVGPGDVGQRVVVLEITVC